jgi:hypothetical protein
MDRPLMIPLICKGCGSPLDGSGDALVFVCRQCRTARHMAAPEKAYPLAYVKNHLEMSGERLYAPFWRLAGQVHWSTLEPAKQRAYSNAKPLGHLYFPAFWSPRVAYYDNLTQSLALSKDPMLFEERSDAIVDGYRDPGTLGEMARLTWLAYLDRIADVTDVKLTFTVEEIIYAALPFFRAGDRYVDGVLGVQLPPAFFEG